MHIQAEGREVTLIPLPSFPDLIRQSKGPGDHFPPPEESLVDEEILLSVSVLQQACFRL